MPYKNVEERRLKQKECMRKLRGCCSVNPNQPQKNGNITVIDTTNTNYDVNKKTEQKTCCSVNPNQPQKNGNITVIDTTNTNYDVNKKTEQKTCCSVNPNQQKEKRPWTWTVNGVIIPLPMTDAMPLSYR